MALTYRKGKIFAGQVFCYYSWPQQAVYSGINKRNMSHSKLYLSITEWQICGITYHCSFTANNNALRPLQWPPQTCWILFSGEGEGVLAQKIRSKCLIRSQKWKTCELWNQWRSISDPHVQMQSHKCSSVTSSFTATAECPLNAPLSSWLWALKPGQWHKSTTAEYK